MTEENPNAFKNSINAKTVKTYSKELQVLLPHFDARKFQKIASQLPTLELKSRVRLIAHELQKHLQQDHKKALQILLQVSHSKNLSSFELWPISEFIRLLGPQHFELSFAAMADLTSRFTSEFAVRPLIQHNPQRAFALLKEQASHNNVHIRRWVSEGSRPYLPWGEKLTVCVQDPTENLKILELLKFDSELYVRKSVANHLNDLTKDHPDLVIQTLQRWKKDLPENYKKEFQFLMSRALRTLIKKRHKKALEMMGVSNKQNELKITGFKLHNRTVKYGQTLNFLFQVSSASSKPQKLIIDYAIHFRKANGQLSEKVFKLKTTMLAPNSSIKIQKAHKIKPITTRKYYQGKQELEVFLNGVAFAKQAFILTGV